MGPELLLTLAISTQLGLSALTPCSLHIPLCHLTAHPLTPGAFSRLAAFAEGPEAVLSARPFCTCHDPRRRRYSCHCHVTGKDADAQRG